MQLDFTGQDKMSMAKSNYKSTAKLQTAVKQSIFPNTNFKHGTSKSYMKQVDTLIKFQLWFKNMYI